MPRFRTPLLALALATAFAAPAMAQTVGYNIRTGDVWVDTRLGEINDYGHRYRDPFIGELTGHYGAPRSLVVELLDRRGWAPADVYFACAIARAVGRPCLEVVREYDRAPGQGWGAVAQRMGIKPGSPAFHALKRGTVATYDRWGHPVAIDRAVRVDWSQSGPGAKGGKHAAGRNGNGNGNGNGKPAAAKGKPAHAGHGGPGANGDHGGKGKGHGQGGGKGQGGGGKGEGKGGKH